MIEFWLSELVACFGGELVGDGAIRLAGYAAVPRAMPGQIAFVDTARDLRETPQCRASVLVVPPRYASMSFADVGSVWVHHDPTLLFAKTVDLFESSHPDDSRLSADCATSIHETAEISALARVSCGVRIGRSSTIDEGVEIGANAVIGKHVSVGPMTRIHANATICDGCHVGRDCVIHSGAVIGSDGMRFAWDGSEWAKVRHIGCVRIGDRVEIGANTAIDRGMVDDTTIGNGVKLDNLVHIAHDVRVGDDTIMAARVAIAGHASIGRRCRFAGCVAVFGDIEIADDVTVAVAAVVSKSISRPGMYAGYFPISDFGKWKRNASRVRHLADMQDRIRSLEARLGKRDEID